MKYSTFKRCHLGLVMSFETRAYAAVIGKPSAGSGLVLVVLWTWFFLALHAYIGIQK